MAGGGFYGKLPSEGDFVTRRLPWEFTAAWDDWLQQGMQASREACRPCWSQSSQAEVNSQGRRRVTKSPSLGSLP